MALRLGGLADLDPAAVPLPTGTEVTVRTDGRSARVVGVDGERVEVAFLDGARATFLRGEVAPRKLGVARYAQRRANAWDALLPCVVVDAVVGSRAWGVSDAGSDEDHRGVFVLPAPWLNGLADPPLDLVSADGSVSYWELGKAIRQALRADPNTLEMLYAAPRVVDELGQGLVEMRDAFVSQEIYGAFGRYALSQLDRLEHNQRLAEHRAIVIGWLREEALAMEDAAVRLAREARIEASDPVGRAREYLKQLYRSLYDQGAIAANDWASLAAAARTELELPRDLRPKNAYNLIRLLDSAIRWLSGEPPSVRVSDDLRPTLIAIKQGELPTSEVMRLAQAMVPRLEAARAASPLPVNADVARAERVLRAARDEAARRWLMKDAGPWGREAPAPPEASYD